MTPNEIRPHLLDFESKGYTNPTLMYDVLKGLGVEYQTTYRGDHPLRGCELEFGLMRIQYGGPWTKPGVPMRARYRQTHWVAVAGEYVFDINGIHRPGYAGVDVGWLHGAWLPNQVWSKQLMPWLMKECCPKSDGTFWPTHGIEITDARFKPNQSK